MSDSVPVDDVERAIEAFETLAEQNSGNGRGEAAAAYHDAAEYLEREVLPGGYGR